MAGFDGNGKWVRDYSWVNDKNTGDGKISAERMDADTDAICRGLEQCITRNGKDVKPIDDMDWNNQKIINLKAGEADNDAITLKQLQIGGNLIFEGKVIDSEVDSVVIDFPVNIVFSAEDTGMRFFIRFSAAINGNFKYIKPSSKNDKYEIRDMDGVNGITIQNIHQNAIREFIFYRTPTDTGHFRLVDMYGLTANNTLSNVTSVSSDSVIKDYIVASATKIFSDNVFGYAEKTRNGVVTISGRWNTKMPSTVNTFTINFSTFADAAIFKFSVPTYCFVYSFDMRRANRAQLINRNISSIAIRIEGLDIGADLSINFTAIGLG
ncbi:hypothetical protein FACS189496_2170 [Bacilli bacterium]|nr:hypothetical protein FACS189496_2170 [Bacilli bacterium]